VFRTYTVYVLVAIGFFQLPDRLLAQDSDQEIRTKVLRDLRRANGESVPDIETISLSDARGKGLTSSNEQENSGSALPDWKYGAYVKFVEKYSPADLAGIKPCDIIIKIGEKKIYSAEDVNSALKGFQGGEAYEVSFARLDSSYGGWHQLSAKIVVPAPALTVPTTRPDESPIPNFDIEYLKSHPTLPRWQYATLEYSDGDKFPPRVVWDDGQQVITGSYTFEIYKRMGGSADKVANDALLFNLLGSHGWEFVQKYDAPESFVHKTCIILFRRPI
jgi:membrane-associated protease RseP (regulator of RpoE activity)